jgi:type IV pilus assembly protein PilM
MLNSKTFLAVDFGAGSLKLAEFESDEAGGLRLKQFAIKPLGLEGSQETKREAVILKALQEAIAERSITARDVNVCAPGFHVFSKFVKLPPVDSGKVTQIIEYEAKSNVPFPLEEVVWDYQILGTSAGGEMEVLLVAIKADIVEGLFRTNETAGLRLQLCDVSPAALCNAFRYNYGDLEDCTLLLDIGAKTCNLLFFEKGKIFSRSISLGANSITQDFANEAKLKFDVAEKIKIEEGFVSLGGAYEEPENPHQAAISKIARQFMTRLHIQVNQTLQFYRGQQGGGAPQRLFLSGGASIMPYTAQFFAEKLGVPVEYFNPFRSLQIDPGINLEDLAKSAHSLGEVVGLGLRRTAHCPVELNLMPESTLRWQSFNQKKPYLLATFCSLVLMTFAVGYLFDKLTGVKRAQLEDLNRDLERPKSQETQFKRVNGELKKAQADLEQVSTWLEDRTYWAEILRNLQTSLQRAEDRTKRELGTDTGVWIEQLTSTSYGTAHAIDPAQAGGASAAPTPAPAMTAEMAESQRKFYERYGIPMGGARMPSPGGLPAGEAAPGAATDPNAAATPANSNEVATVTLLCRAVDLTKVSGIPADANLRIAYAFENEVKTNPLIDGDKTKLIHGPDLDENSGTFTFGVNLALKRPIKL